MMRAWLAIVATGLLTGACSQERPEAIAECALPAYELVASEGLLRPPETLALNDREMAPTALLRQSNEPISEPFKSVIEEALSVESPPSDIAAQPTAPTKEPRSRAAQDAPQPARIAVLSGGSQDGAFGAGFFDSLDDVPDYEVVTSISTGALQATFVFLANRPVPADRTYAAYMTNAEGVGEPGESNLGDLRLAYALSGEEDVMDVSWLGLLSVATNGSLGSFDPLRETLRGLISHGTLEMIAAEGQKDPATGTPGRKLLVGVTNVDDGKAYAVDMTKLAATEGLSMEQKRDCYVEVLLASSTVPPGVPPITLELEVLDSAGQGQHEIRDKELYIDGGARYGVFLDNVIDAVKETPSVNVDLVVNRELFAKPWINEDDDPVERWSVVNLGLRTVKIVENQVYQLSVERLLRWADDRGSVRMAFISSNRLNSLTEDPMTEFVYDNGRGTTCGEALKTDKKELSPNEFHPTYMRCLGDYGAARGAVDPWNLDLD